MDKITFARLVSFLSARYKISIGKDELREIDEMIAAQPMAATDGGSASWFCSSTSSADDVIALMAAMADGRKIDAIKAFRTLTGSDLITSKSRVESVMNRRPT